MSRVDKRLIFAAAALLMIFSAMTSSAAVIPAGRECDVAADVALEVGDYPTAIKLHQDSAIGREQRARALSSGVRLRDGGTYRRRDR